MPLTLKNFYRTSRLPDGYQEVEYIWVSWQSWQYISTWVAVKNWLEFDLQIKQNTAYTNNVAIFWNLRSASAIFLYVYQSHYRLHYGWSTIDWSSISNDKITINVKPDSLTIDWVTTSVTHWSTFNSWYMNIWRANWWDPTNLQWMFDLYSMQIKDNWTLVRDFVPCYRKQDTVIWLYDLVNDQFYTNAGSWTFTKWPDAN